MKTRLVVTGNLSNIESNCCGVKKNPVAHIMVSARGQLLGGGGTLVQCLMQPAWKIRDRRLEPHSSLHVLKN